MKKAIVFVALFFWVCVGLAQSVKNIEPTYVDPSRRAAIVVEFDTKVAYKPSADKYALMNSSGEKVYCSQVQAANQFVTFIFEINSGDFSMFEKLVSDSTGYWLTNDESMQFTGGTIKAGQLETLTKSRIGDILEDDWKRYVLNEYSSQFLFPHRFNVGTRLGIEDSTKTVYFLELVQSGNWVDNTAVSLFWGLKGRWSTDASDKFNYVQFYPLTALLSETSWRLSASTGVETGYQGFGKFGRGTLKGEMQFRLPFNPVDLTLGNPRWRINPVVNLSVQGNSAWSNTKLPDSLKNGLDATAQIRYDIPVAKSYYLQTKVEGNYSTTTKELQYEYEFALGYIADGNVRVMAYYKQGFQSITYQYDRQLLLGFAFDVLNQSAAK